MRVETLLEDDRVFEAGRVVTIRGAAGTKSAEIEFFRRQHGRLIVKLRGVESISEAEKLTGAELAVEEGTLPENAKDTFYSFHLKGCEVVSSRGEMLGTVADVLDGRGPALLKVDGPEGEVLIPFVQAFLRRVDIEQKKIEVALPEGLRDLNK